MEVIVCKLKQNPLGQPGTTGAAYPADQIQMRLPGWFKELPFGDAREREEMTQSAAGHAICW
jgi:hypothetical protein